MSLVLTDNQHYTAIAAKIRELTGSTDTYTPAEMPAGIQQVYDASSQGLSSEDVEKAISNNGKRTDYRWAFRMTDWSGFNFKHGFSPHNLS